MIESDYAQSPYYHTSQDEFSTLVIPFEVEIVKLGLATLCSLNGLSTGAENIHEISSLPVSFELDQNYPNPFNPSTTIHFTLPKPCVVSLKIYDLLGNEIVVLISGQKQSGEYTVEWTAKDLPCGIYLYRLEAGDIVETKKMILQK